MRRKANADNIQATRPNTFLWPSKERTETATLWQQQRILRTNQTSEAWQNMTHNTSERCSLLASCFAFLVRGSVLQGLLTMICFIVQLIFLYDSGFCHAISWFLFLPCGASCAIISSEYLLSHVVVRTIPLYSASYVAMPRSFRSSARFVVVATMLSFPYVRLTATET